MEEERHLEDSVALGSKDKQQLEHSEWCCGSDYFCLLLVIVHADPLVITGIVVKP